MQRVNVLLRYWVTGVFLTVETTFLIANLVKFEEGGYISVSLGVLLMGLMLFWYRGEAIKARLTRFDSLPDNLPLLQALSCDPTIPKFATHLVYLTRADDHRTIESETLYSILNQAPKRADIYWFIHVCVDDQPFGIRYKVDTLAHEDAYFVTFYLGFRVEPRINLLFRMVVGELVRNGEVTVESRYQSLRTHRVAGDFRFVLFRSFLSYDNDLSVSDQLIMRGYLLLRNISLSAQATYGLDTSNVVTEDVPLVLSSPENIRMVRIE